MYGSEGEAHCLWRPPNNPREYYELECVLLVNLRNPVLGTGETLTILVRGTGGGVVKL